jgi:hypothetical protein
MSNNINKGVGLEIPTPSKLLAGALAYATYLQWPVIPIHSITNGKCTCQAPNCQNVGKHPRIRNWQEAATTDEETIREWWKKWPYSNIGVLTGERSGMFALDIDVKSNGKDSLDELIEKYGRLPDTVEQITGSRGSHYLFRYIKGIKNRVGILPGVDIRGEGGYIIVSPSIHYSGNRYEWELLSRPLQVPIADPPTWLTNLILEDNVAPIERKSSDYWMTIMQGFREHDGRNNAAASLAGHLFRRYVDPLLVVEIMDLWNERNIPPLEKTELETIIDSIAGIEAKRRKEKRYG